MKNKNLNRILNGYSHLNILINNGYEVEFNHLYIIPKNLDFECRVTNGKLYSEREIIELITENNRVLELYVEFEELEGMTIVENLENCGSSARHILCTLWRFTPHNRDFEIYTNN